MISRREFLEAVCVLGVTAIIPTATSALPQKGAPNSERPIRFTRAVRDITRKIQIKRGRWKSIICHHSGLKNGNAATYDKEHRKRGMENGLAYHFVIGNGVDSQDGKIEVGQRWVRQIKGGHVRSDEMNEVAIGICLIGNFEETRPTRRQFSALCELIEYLKYEVGGGRLKLMSHTEAHPGHTACPGKYFPMTRLHKLYGRR